MLVIVFSQMDSISFYRVERLHQEEMYDIVDFLICN